VIAARRFDRAAFALLMLGILALFVRTWLHHHPEHNPWAPLDLDDPLGWATQSKIAALRDDPAECRAVLARSEVAFTTRAPLGEGACSRPDRLTLDRAPLASDPEMTCALGAAFTLWERRIRPIAQATLGSPLARIEHFGTYSCRRLYGRAEGGWSEHATGNAIDIAAFVLADGRRIAVLKDWKAGDDEAAFLHRVRDEACGVFGTVLSPDYNAAHADHLHLDQAARGFGGVCR
jgi:hypothetical protein